MLLPFRQHKQVANGTVIFAGDIGATKTNLAMYRVENGQYHLLRDAKLVSKDYNNITELTGAFTKNTPRPDAICFGVAGPVLNGHATLSNLQWEIDIKEIVAQYPTVKAHLINDLKATAYGLAVLGEEDIKVLHKGSATPVGNAAVIAPGTGLG
ncbi:MAG TPA: glucokinase, partial [Agriterribacter sp.]|nr:glucokinase [Agriterribacter sp.]